MATLGPCHITVTRKIIISRDVSFDETTLIGDTPNAAERRFNPCDSFQIVMEILNLKENVEQVEILEQAALEENSFVEPIPNAPDDYPATPPQTERVAEIEIPTPEPAVPNQNNIANLISSQHNYRMSRRIQLLESKKSAGKTAWTNGSGELSELDVDQQQNYKEAVQSKYADQWMKAFEEEFQSLIENKSWELVPRSEIRNG